GATVADHEGAVGDGGDAGVVVGTGEDGGAGGDLLHGAGAGDDVIDRHDVHAVEGQYATVGDGAGAQLALEAEGAAGADVCGDARGDVGPIVGVDTEEGDGAGAEEV